jgi:hypothetical protein
MRCVCRPVPRLARRCAACPGVWSSLPLLRVTQHVLVAVIVTQREKNTLCYFIPHFSSIRQASAGNSLCALLRVFPILP